MDTTTPRRRRRHDETRAEILDLAVEIMAEQGVAGLSLGEVARRLGVRTPSLYTYFDSKNALYDELFRRGWQSCLDAVATHHDRIGPVGPESDVVARVLTVNETFVRWSLDHPELSQLMMTRPVPLWEPTAEAYRPSVEVFGRLLAELRASLELGLLDPSVDLDELAQNLASAAAGVIIRQLSNEPGVTYGDGAASRHFPALIRALMLAHLPERNPHASD